MLPASVEPRASQPSQSLQHLQRAAPPLRVRTCARAGLLGNPSDVYGGKAIALAVDDFAAEIAVAPAPGLRLDAEEGARRLVRAALARLPEAGEAPVRLSVRTDVPRQVGLAGSSAIVVGALRALCAWCGVRLHPAELAERALAAEAEELGIVAGPMDRVVQAYGGLVAMDCHAPRGPGSYRRLSPDLLPPLFLAWDPEPGEPSGSAHAEVRARFAAGDPAVRSALARLPRLVDEGLECLGRGDVVGFQRLVDLNFDIRAGIWPLRPRDREMVEIGRCEGAAVKFCGSGGAVLGVMRDPAEYPGLERAYRRAGLRILRPRVGPPTPEALKVEAAEGAPR